MRRTTALWLSAILLVVSFASAGHNHQHVDDGTQAECTLCFHQHQFNKGMPAITLVVPVQPQTYVSSVAQHYATTPSHRVYFQSRAPPQSSIDNY